MKKLLSLFAALSITVMTCAPPVSAADEKKEIVFADVGWDSIELNNAIAGLIAEEIFGYTWSEVPGSTPITHEALIN